MGNKSLGNFENILKDLKKKETDYSLYVPDELKRSIDSDSKLIIDIYKKEIQSFHLEIIAFPPKAFEGNLKRIDFSKTIRGIKSTITSSDSESKDIVYARLAAFNIKGRQIFDFLIETYTAFYQRVKKFSQENRRATS